MKKVRILYLALALLLLFSSVSGCGGASPAATPAASSAAPAAAASESVAPASTEAVATEAPATESAAPAEQLPRPKGYDVVSELKAYPDVMKLSVLADLWGSEVNPEDSTAKYLLDTFKLDTTGLTVDMTGKFGDVARARVAANDLPDAILTFSYPLAIELAASGQFLDLSDVLANYAPDTIDNIGTEVLDKYRDKDGKLIVFPGNTIPTNDLSTYLYPQDGPMINSTFLAKAGLKAPTNTTELYNYLKAISTQKFNGKKVIPMGNSGFDVDSYTTDGYPISSSHFTQMFAPGTGYQMLVKNDATQMIDLVYDHAAYLQFLQFFNKLYREKLLDQDAFTLTKDQYNERVKSGVYGFSWGGSSDITPANTALSGKILEPYQPIKMIKNYEGNSKTYTFAVLGNWYFLFNKNIADPVRLAKYIDWQYTLQGVQIINYGAPDKDRIMNVWNYDDAGKVVFDQALQKKWDAEDYSWNWKKAGGWGFHSAGLRACIKYTAINEMGLCMADDMYLAIDKLLNTEMTMDPNFEAMNLQPVGPVCADKGASLRDLLNKWEVRIIINAKSEEDAGKMYQQMMTEVRANGYDDIKKELYGNYMKANPAK